VGSPAPDGPEEVGLVGRADVLDRIRTMRAAAGRGALGVLILEGEAGIGKTAVAEAAVRSAAAEGWTPVWVQGVQTDTVLAHAGLLAVVTALRPHLAELADPQRHALLAAVGWSEPEPSGDRFAVAAATLGCSRRRPRWGRCSWSSTTCPGWTGSPPTRSSLRPAGCGTTGSPSC
jgi:hypothetical protein